MKNIKNILFIASVIFISSFGVARAGTAVNLNIVTDTESFYDDKINVEPCDSDSDPNTPDTITAYCALVQLENSQTLPTKSNWSGLWVNSINGVANTDAIFWMWLVNLNIDNPYSDFTCHQDAPSGCSAKQYILNPNDSVLFYYNTNPLNISVDNENPKVGENIKITAKELGLDGWNSVWNKAALGKVIINSNSYDLDADGTFSYEIKNSDVLSIKAQKANFIDSPELTIAPTSLRYSSGSSISNSISTADSAFLAAEKPAKEIFDIEKSFEFLTSQQKENGSFGEDLFTDWSALALALGNNQSSTLKLIKYFGENKISGTFLTDYERHSMALMALGLNPYNINGENYIKKITDSFDGKQFGNVEEDNDDIFALIVLQNAGFAQSEKIISDDMFFLLSKQKTDGSWDGSVDMTAAAIQALKPSVAIYEVSKALQNAGAYLAERQEDNGGWGNVFSTSWALQAMNTLEKSWTKNGKTPNDYLSKEQTEDGAVLSSEDIILNRIWATSYAIPAVLGKSWSDIMQKVKKPVEENTAEKITEIVNQNIEKKTEKVVKKEDLKTDNGNASSAVDIIPQSADLSASAAGSALPKNGKSQMPLVAAISGIIVLGGLAVWKNMLS